MDLFYTIVILLSANTFAESFSDSCITFNGSAFGLPEPLGPIAARLPLNITLEPWFHLQIVLGDIERVTGISSSRFNIAVRTGIEGAPIQMAFNATFNTYDMEITNYQANGQITPTELFQILQLSVESFPMIGDGKARLLADELKIQGYFANVTIEHETGQIKRVDGLQMSIDFGRLQLYLEDFTVAGQLVDWNRYNEDIYDIWKLIWEYYEPAFIERLEEYFNELIGIERPVRTFKQAKMELRKAERCLEDTYPGVTDPSPTTENPIDATEPMLTENPAIEQMIVYVINVVNSSINVSNSTISNVGNFVGREYQKQTDGLFAAENALGKGHHELEPVYHEPSMNGAVKTYDCMWMVVIPILRILLLQQQ